MDSLQAFQKLQRAEMQQEAEAVSDVLDEHIQGISLPLKVITNSSDQDYQNTRRILAQDYKSQENTYAPEGLPAVQQQLTNLHMPVASLTGCKPYELEHAASFIPGQACKMCAP